MMNFFSNKTIMVVVAHPDDELLGLGATMNRLIAEEQVFVHVVILGEGITSRSDIRDIGRWEKDLKIHRDNIRKAQSFIGFKSVNFYDFPDNRFDSVALLDIIKVIEKEKEALKPDIVFTHHCGDVNVDHQKTFEAVITACRPMAHETVKAIVCFETPSGTEWRASSDPRHFIPNLFIEVSQENLNAKISGMEAYEFERRPFPHPRSPEALTILAQRWGVALGCNYAEAFCIVRLFDGI